MKGEIKIVMRFNRKIILFVLLIAIASTYSFIFLIIQKRSQRQEILLFIFPGSKDWLLYFRVRSILLHSIVMVVGSTFFYPYLTLFPAVIFYWITHNLILSYMLYVWVLNVCTILITFYYGRKFFKRVDAAFFI